MFFYFKLLICLINVPRVLEMLIIEKHAQTVYIITLSRMETGNESQ